MDNSCNINEFIEMSGKWVDLPSKLYLPRKCTKVDSTWVKIENIINILQSKIESFAESKV